MNQCPVNVSVFLRIARDGLDRPDFTTHGTQQGGVGDQHAKNHSQAGNVFSFEKKALDFYDYRWNTNADNTCCAMAVRCIKIQ